MTVPADPCRITIGAFYRTADGQVVRTCGWNGRTREVLYYAEGDSVTAFRTVAEADLQRDWARLDIGDFPNAKDPVLPYRFDLFWGLKTQSELRRHLAETDDPEIRQAMVGEGIELGQEPDEQGPGETAAPAT